MDSLSLPYVKAVQNSCQTCEERRVGCHSACERYAAYRAQLNEMKAPRHEKLIADVGFAYAAHRRKLLAERRKRGISFG